MGSSTQEFKPRSDLSVFVGSGRLTERFEAHGGVATAGVAVNAIRRDRGGDLVQRTTFIDLKAFGDDKDRVLSYSRKGVEVDFVGLLETGEYELEIGGEPVFYDDDGDRPVIMRPLELLLEDIQFKPTSARKGKLHKDRNIFVGAGRVFTAPERHGEIVTLTMVVDSVHKVDDVPVEVPTFFKVTVFGPTGQACLDHLEVGQEVKIPGAIQTGEYQLKIGDEPVFYDEAQEKPVLMRPLELLTSRVYFGR